MTTILDVLTDVELGNIYMECHDAIKSAHCKKVGHPVVIRLFLQCGLEIVRRVKIKNQRVGSQYERTYA